MEEDSILSDFTCFLWVLKSKACRLPKNGTKACIPKCIFIWQKPADLNFEGPKPADQIFSGRMHSNVFIIVHSILWQLFNKKLTFVSRICSPPSAVHWVQCQPEPPWRPAHSQFSPAAERAGPDEGWPGLSMFTSSLGPNTRSPFPPISLPALFNHHFTNTQSLIFTGDSLSSFKTAGLPSWA